MKPQSDQEYLRLLTRKLFHSGFNKALVDARWDAFEKAFLTFDPPRVAAMGEEEILRLISNPAIVRHQKKIRATIHNAQTITHMAEEHGSWGIWLRSTAKKPYRERSKILENVFAHCGSNTIFYFLLEAGEVTLADKPESIR
jgi:3-methyladenine DNA glycosylase Tag